VPIFTLTGAPFLCGPFRAHGLHIDRCEGVFSGFDAILLTVEETQIIIEKRDQPNLVVDFAQAKDLACKDLAAIDLALSDTDAPAPSDADGAIMEWIFRIPGRHIDPRRRCIEIAGTGPAQRLMRTLVVVNIDEAIDAFLLLEKVEGGRLCGFLFQGQVHAFVPAVLLGTPWPDAFDSDAKSQPPDRQPGEIVEPVGARKRKAVIRPDGARQSELPKNNSSTEKARPAFVDVSPSQAST